MSKENIIDRSSQQFFKIPNFVPLNFQPPRLLQPIDIQPLPPIHISPTIMLNQQILERLGVKKQVQNPTLMDSFFACKACSSTSNEAKTQIRTQINEDEQPHLNDADRKQEYKEQWQKIKKKAVKVPPMTFDNFYQSKGNLNASLWKEQVKKLFT